MRPVQLLLLADHLLMLGHSLGFTVAGNEHPGLESLTKELTASAKEPEFFEWTRGIRRRIHEEKVEWEHKSNIDGKMHACGHDSHVAMLLGATELLHAKIDTLELSRWSECHHKHTCSALSAYWMRLLQELVHFLRELGSSLQQSMELKPCPIPSYG
ncbi:unnamed protein product [Linum tenue]|uniref:Uncharacterized protein n=1 Tax=Linum tenue TaxID=586396 RepID=A0AAV0L6P5_9ROSI|nr:unnamed protein product [Linum tenue]